MLSCEDHPGTLPVRVGEADGWIIAFLDRDWPDSAQVMDNPDIHTAGDLLDWGRKQGEPAAAFELQAGGVGSHSAYDEWKKVNLLPGNEKEDRQKNEQKSGQMQIRFYGRFGRRISL